MGRHRQRAAASTDGAAVGAAQRREAAEAGVLLLVVRRRRRRSGRAGDHRRRRRPRDAARRRPHPRRRHRRLRPPPRHRDRPCGLRGPPPRGGLAGRQHRFGAGVAILLGDLALAYSDRLLAGAPPAARAVFDEVRIEVNVGQYLDILGAAQDPGRSGRRWPGHRQSGRRGRSAKPSIGPGASAGTRRRSTPSSALCIWARRWRPPPEPGRCRAAVGLRPAPRRGFPAARRPARAVRRSVAHRQAGRRRSPGGKAHAAGHPGLRPGRPAPGPGCSRRASARPDLSGAEVLELRSVIEATGARSEVETAIDRLAAAADAALLTLPVGEEARRALGELAAFATGRDHDHRRRPVSARPARARVGRMLAAPIPRGCPDPTTDQGVA